jgi:hypothetical protein
MRVESYYVLLNLRKANEWARLCKVSQQNETSLTPKRVKPGWPSFYQRHAYLHLL